MNKKAPRLSKLAIKNDLVWGWATVPGKPVVDVHLYVDGRHAATEITGIELPATLRRRCGAPPHANAAFCFSLPPSLRDGFEHTLQAALPLANDDGIYSELLRIDGTGIRGHVHQQGRALTGTVWFTSAEMRAGKLVITNDKGQVVYRRVLTPLLGAEPKGYPATFSLLVNELPPERVHIRCEGHELAGSPLVPIEFMIGSLETCNKDGISGWAFNALDPLKPIELCLRIDGKAVRWFRPNLLRKDLPEALSLREEAMGITGFHVSPPEILFDGITHFVEVVCAASGFPIAGGQVHVRWSVAGNLYTARPPIPALPKKRLRFPPPRVSVVVLNRNGARVLDEMLVSWERYNSTVAAEIIVIDHNSTDGSRALLKQWRKRIDLRMVELNENDSFSASSNRGAALARGEFLLFLNNDIQWLHDSLPRMLESLQDDSVGIVGMKLLKVVGESRTGGRHASEVQHLGVRFTLNDKGYWPYEIKPDLHLGEEEHCPQTVPAVTGAALLCRKSDFDAIGGFDTGYFYGFEDVELCVRLARRLDKQIICRNDCVALHHHGHTRLSGRERSMFDRLAHNSKMLESHIGLWIKQAFWQSLYQGDALFTREKLRIGLVGEAAELAPAIAAAMPHASIVLLTPQDEWKRVDGIHVLIVGDPRYDIRSVNHARADLLCLAWLRDTKTSWTKLAWWHDFAAVISPARVAKRIGNSMTLPVLASSTTEPLGTLLAESTLFVRVVIRCDMTRPDMAKTAHKLRTQLRKAGLPCWLQTPEGLPIRVANVCVTLRDDGSTSIPPPQVTDGMLQVVVPLAASLPSPRWLQTELEKQVGSTFQSS